MAVTLEQSTAYYAGNDKTEMHTAYIVAAMLTWMLWFACNTQPEWETQMPRACW